MASITFDGQSFLIDGRRTWLVAGTIHWARATRDMWPALIHQAKSAGFNTVTVPVIWARHEPRPSQFDFTGDNDLRAFVELVGQAGMHAVLRVGPYVGGGYDLGGLPSWLLTLKDAALRTNNTAFLEACSRYFGALSRQLRDLLATATPAGPVLLVQSESAWTCGADDLARLYLGELDRYLRESGFDVPIINNHQLWNAVEGEIDTWTGSRDLLAQLRQFSTVRTDQPKFVSALELAHDEHWGGPARPPVAAEPAALQRSLVQALAAGAQFNIEPIFGGTSLGFSAGRSASASESFLCSGRDGSAAIDAFGRASPLMPALRRVCTFASRFARVLASLHPDRHPVTLVPPGADLGHHAGSPARARRSPGSGHHEGQGPVVVYRSGSQGSVAFVFAGDDAGADHAPDAHRTLKLLLPTGESLALPIGAEPVGWYLFDSRLVGRSHLDYANLSPAAMVGRALVLVGPPGAAATVSINGSPMGAVVPASTPADGKADEGPELVDHEGVLIVLCNPAQFDALHITDEALFYGCSGVNAAGQGLVHDAQHPVLRIGGDGTVTHESHAQMAARRAKAAAAAPPPPAPVTPPTKPAKATKGRKAAPAPPPPPPPPLPPATLALEPVVKPLPAPTLGEWQAASVQDYLRGESPRFASISGPADLATLGAASGYGWYKVQFKPASGGKATVAWPRSGDRLHLFLDGHDSGVLGVGPAASRDLDLPLRRADHTLVVLAENLGRFDGGHRMAEPKGAWGHLMEVKPAKLAKPVLHRDDQIAALETGGPLMGVHAGDMTDPVRASWAWEGKRKHPLLIRSTLAAPGSPHAGLRGLVLLNGARLAFFDATGPATLLIDPEEMARGTNRLELAFLNASPANAADFAGAMEFFDCVANLTEGGQWSFAKWEPPGGDHFAKAPTGRHPPGPAWFRARFELPGNWRGPLVLDTAGLTKGQAYVNGRHLGRYFTATPRHAAVGPQTTLAVPGALLLPGATNEVLIFDEHGALPTKVRLTLPPPAPQPPRA